ncbi:hypothetical protein ACFOG5_23870 [Pedobacter fastidiosus]|uniref:Lipoprotein n=1 Tax=Pedobacter fastidiosus TaxID=2765361 RepID=A0ABR7KWX1_9SPHI|nr:hypothetical protein [Pedobacter fastidiosus]MBC6112593.1 hypothetical protein [Pedobacter fastidiosus]
MKTLQLFTIFILVSCKNTGEQNSVFSLNKPQSEPYKTELSRQINKTSNQELTYIFNGYQKIKDKEYVDIIIKGEDFEAKTLVLVNYWGKLENIKKKEGKGYKGSELKHLVISKITNNPYSDFEYKDVEEILD